MKVIQRSQVNLVSMFSLDVSGFYTSTAETSAVRGWCFGFTLLLIVKYMKWFDGPVFRCSI